MTVDTTTNQLPESDKDNVPAPRPDEAGSVVIGAFLRITDPSNNEIILETRG